MMEVDYKLKYIECMELLQHIWHEMIEHNLESTCVFEDLSEFLGMGNE